MGTEDSRHHSPGPCAQGRGSQTTWQVPLSPGLQPAKMRGWRSRAVDRCGERGSSLVLFFWVFPQWLTCHVPTVTSQTGPGSPAVCVLCEGRPPPAPQSALCSVRVAARARQDDAGTQKATCIHSMHDQ